MGLFACTLHKSLYIHQSLLTRPATVQHFKFTPLTLSHNTLPYSQDYSLCFITFIINYIYYYPYIILYYLLLLYVFVRLTYHRFHSDLALDSFPKWRVSRIQEACGSGFPLLCTYLAPQYRTFLYNLVLVSKTFVTFLLFYFPTLI